MNNNKINSKENLGHTEMYRRKRVSDKAIEENKEKKKREKFYLASDVVNKRISEKKKKYFTYESKEISELLKETFINKMKQAGITEDPTLEIYFDTTYH